MSGHRSHPVGQHRHPRDSQRLAVYEKGGGYQAAQKALGMDPGAIMDEVKGSGLRGRGGAGFPDRHEVGLHPQGQPASPSTSC